MNEKQMQDTVFYALEKGCKATYPIHYGMYLVVSNIIDALEQLQLVDPFKAQTMIDDLYMQSNEEIV